MKRGIVVLAVALCTIFALADLHPALAAKVTLKYAHTGPPDPEGTSYHPIAVKFKQLVEAYTKGQVEVKIFPSFQLGDEAEEVQGVSMGTIDVSNMASTNFFSFVPSAGFATLPYIFRDHYEAWTVFDHPTFREKVRAAAIKQANVRILEFVTLDFRVLTNSKKPVKNLSDLSGLKIRVPKNTQMLETFKAWGQPAVSMAWSEVFTALQQKVIDGQENPYGSLKDYKLYEVQKYISNLHYMLWTGPLIIHEPLFQKLSPEIQDAIVRAAHQTDIWNRIRALDLSARDLGFLVKEKGMIANDLEDEKIWEEKALSIWPSFYKDFGPDGVEIVKEVCKILGKKTPGL
jgi:TRAP-type transport system periplasmic protein